MMPIHDASIFTPLVLLTSVTFLHLSTSSLASSLHPADIPRRQSENLVQEAGPVQEEQEELFKDVDPRTLAAVLLEALNHSRVEEERNEGGMKDERGVEGADRHRDGRQQLEMLIASGGKDREREEEEERKKALEEEERMTEKVSSRTSVQTVPVQAPQQEEQLSPEELKSLETMMKEFPRLDSQTEPEAMQRASRAFSSYNHIIPIGKGSDLAMSKKKLKWQEETQKALLFPAFPGSSSLEEGKDRKYAQEEGKDRTYAQDEGKDRTYAHEEEALSPEQEEEALSPEQEEARAKVEQEEMMRQAAEVQSARLEEEKLADMASDMLLRYMVKDNNKKYSSSPSNAAEDKRSEEEPGRFEEEDLDPQTIDKLIEISSKLHLPADDVVDIIADVEKKKKKDVPPEVSSAWQRPPSPPSSSFLPGWQLQNNFPVSRQPSPAVNLLRSWFQKKKTLKSEDPPRKLSKLWSRPEKTRLQSPPSLWADFPYVYPTYHWRRVFPGYYPSPVRYYPPQPARTHNDFLGNSVDDSYTLQPRRYYPSRIHRYPPITYPWPFLRARPPPQPPQKQFYSWALGESRKPDRRLDDVEKYIQQILEKRPQRTD